MGQQILLKSMMALSVLALSACGGGGGNSAGLSCTSLAPLVDGPNATNNCVAGDGCTINNPGNVADGNFGSTATLSQNGSTSGYTAVDVKASGGGVFAAGTVIGIIFEASTATQTGVSYQLNTYLAGVQQDSVSLGGDGFGSSEPRSIYHYSSTTTRPYDTVEFKYLRASGTTTGTAKVYELCSD